MSDDHPLRVGSLFSGYLGLDQGIAAAFADLFGIETRLAWASDIEPGPCKVIAYRHPDVPNLGDITAIDWHTVPEVDLIGGGSPCFPAGTLVATARGYRPIESIVEGDLVLTHRGRYMPVVQTMNRFADDTLLVRAQGAPAFTTTREHPFYVRERRRAWDNSRRRYIWHWSDPTWVAAGNLTPAHFVGYQLDKPTEEGIGVDLGYLIGRWLGDGWLRTAKRASRVEQGHRGSRVTSHWHQAFICCAHEEASELAAAISRAGFRAGRFDERTVTKFRINSRALVQRLLGFGQGAAGKRVPGWVFSLPLEDQGAIWRGWMDADGSVKAATGQERATTISVELAHGMARIGRNVHARHVSVHSQPVPATTTIEGRTVRQQPQFQVCLSRSNRDAKVEGGWIWAPIRSVSKADPTQVYNIGVQEDESYTAWGIAVHNCQDISQAGRMAGMVTGTRSNLWTVMRDAIATLEPMFVVWENVGAALSTKAASASLPDHLDRAIDHHLAVAQETHHAPTATRHTRAAHRLMEYRTRRLGVPYPKPALRALGRVLGDLASLGYDAVWHSNRAADIGAPHARRRQPSAARGGTPSAFRT